jgi:putative peptide maturation dehydrogenase
VEALVRGNARLEYEPGLRSFSILTGEEHDLEREELDALLRLPWDRAVETDDPLLGELVRKGLVVVEGNGAGPRDERLTEASWNLYAALYHARTRWSGVDLEIGDGAAAAQALTAATRAHIERHGSPPPHVHAAPNATETRTLPLVERGGGLYDALEHRKTSRAFDTSRRLREDELSVLLRTVYGVQGTAPIANGGAGVRRTSPSGGGLHPIEAYPLVIDAEDVEPGLYHYHSGDHSLELVERLSRADAEKLAGAFTCGQGYFSNASLLVVLAARFGRSFWKYRGHEKAYAVTLMDAGHLSQTFYLVATELGLGPFVTTVINHADIDRRLGLDPYEEGALAICGCGQPLSSPEVTPDRPFIPGETELEA